MSVLFKTLAPALLLGGNAMAMAASDGQKLQGLLMDQLKKNPNGY